MADFNNVYKWIVSMAILMSVMINSKNVVNGQMLRGKIDVVIMLAPLFQESQRDVYKQSVLKMITNHLDIGDDKVRVAFIDFGVANTESNVLLPLSGDRGAIVGALMKWSPGINVGLHAVVAMQSCKWSACEFEKNDRAKVVVAHLQYYVSKDEDGMEVARDVRQRGAYLYFVINRDDPLRFVSWTGSPMRLHPLAVGALSAVTSLQMQHIVNAIEDDLCGSCRFNAPGQKQCEWKRFEADDSSYFGSDHAACSRLQSPLSECASECEWKCNRDWPWEKRTWDVNPNKPDCDQLQCGLMRRDPILPPSTSVENCNSEFDCRKPECPPTTSSTSTASMASTTISTSTPTATASENSTATSPTTTPKTTIMTTSTTASSTTSPTVSFSKMSTITESNSTPVGRIIDDRKESDSPDSKVLPVWVIAVIVVVAVVLLLAIVVGIVVVKKRKRHAREKRTKMERAKRLEEIEEIGMEKKRHDAAFVVTRSKSASAAKPSISPKVNVLETSIISKWKGADASTHADMSMATAAARKSKTSSAAVGKSKSSKAASSSKFPDGKHESKGGGEKPSKKIGVEGSKLAAKSSQEKSKGKMESKSSPHVVEEKKSEPSKMGSSSKKK